MKDKGCRSSSFAYYLVIIGALNWGLVGAGQLFGINLNIVNIAFGAWAYCEATVYILIGFAAIMTLIGCRCKTCTECRADAVTPPMK